MHFSSDNSVGNAFLCIFYDNFLCHWNITEQYPMT